MELFIIYIILSAFGIAGTNIGDESSALTKIIICITFGWSLFPGMIMFVFGKFIANLNDKY